MKMGGESLHTGILVCFILEASGAKNGRIRRSDWMGMVKSTGINTGPSSPFDRIWHEVYQMDEVLSSSISHFTFHFPSYSKFLWICGDIMKAYGESQIRNFYNICDPLSVALASFPRWAKWILTYSL
jgi:hypothetical protein